MVFEIDSFLALTIGILVYFAGMKINAGIGFLRNYNIPEPVTGGLLAAVLSAGFTGFSLGATPTAIANMTAATKSHGPAPIALLILPLVVAFFAGITNAFVIQFFLEL